MLASEAVRVTAHSLTSKQPLLRSYGVSSAIGASFVSSLPSTKNNTAANISKNKTKRTNGNSQAHLGCTCISQKLSNSKAIKELT